MARTKRTSISITNAQTRAAALASLGPKLDLGNDLTLEAYIKYIEAVSAMLTAYNTGLSELDGKANELSVAEKNLTDLTSRMLAAVAVKFGRDSEEYAKAGGVRISDRARAKKTPVAAAAKAKA